MKCEEAVEKILSSDGALNEELKQHILACPACKKMSNQWLGLRGIKPQGREISLSLDFAVKNAVSEYAGRQISYHKILNRWVSFAAVAASIVLVALACFSLIQPHDAKSGVVLASVHSQTLNPAASSSPKSIWSDQSIQNDILDLGVEVEFNIMTGYSKDHKDLKNINGLLQKYKYSESLS